VISLTGATIGPNAQCQFSVTVTGAAAGVKNNITGPLTTNETGTGGTAAASVTVSPCVAMSISCPATITKFTDSGQNTATINPGTPTVTGGCSPTVTGIRNDGKPLNAPYPKGVTLIAWTAKDAFNFTASCSQTVIVMAPSGQRKAPESLPEEEENLLLYVLLVYFTGHW
jgi:hypothetical protein